MAEKKQHVELRRKLWLRTKLLPRAGPGAAYVPYIGEGDIADALYRERTICGADINAKRIDTANARLPGATLMVADCERWPFSREDPPPFSIADFDAYGNPYVSFKAFWEHAPKVFPLVVFFTDGLKMNQVMQNVVYDVAEDTWSPATLTEKRTQHNFWLQRAIIPWVNALIAPHTIREKAQYLRYHMVYWGIVIE